MPLWGRSLAPLHGAPLEFRQHNGIVDADRAVHWLRFLDAFISESARIARSGAPLATAPVAAPAASVASRRLTSGQRRVFDLISQTGGATMEAVSARLGMQIHSARAVVTRIRQCGYNVRVNRVGGETRYEVTGAAEAATDTPAPVAAPTAPADSLWAGVDEKVATFYRNRAAVLALPQ